MLALPELLAWARLGWGRGLRWLLGLMAAWGLTYGAIVAGRPRWWFAKFHPIFNLDTHSPLFAWLPDLSEPTPRAYALCAAWGLVALGLAWLLARA